MTGTRFAPGPVPGASNAPHPPRAGKPTGGGWIAADRIQSINFRM